MSLLTTILNLTLLPRLKKGQPAGAPRISVVIPARNEEKAIERTVRSFLAQQYRPTEIIVVNDRSTDATGAILQCIADETGLLHVVDGSEPPEGWLGKPWALQQGGERAAGELLLFVDSDIDYEPHTVGSVLAFWEKEKPSFITLLPHIEMRGFWEKLLMPQLANVALGTLPLWMASRTRSRHLAIGGGTGNLITREAWERLGGHRRLRNAVIDDVGLARQVRGFLGEPTVALRAEAFVSVRMYEGLRQIVRGFSKNAFSIFGGSLAGALVAVLLAFVSQILPYAIALSGVARWFTAGVLTPVEAISIVTVGVISVTRLILFGTLGYSLLHALFSLPLSMTIWLAIVLRSTWLSGIRRELSWRGRTYRARPTTFGEE